MSFISNKKYKIAKVPVILQMEFLECGAAALAMILAYYGKWLPLEKIRLDCGVSRDGSNADNIMKAAKKYNLDAEAYSVEIDDLKEGNIDEDINTFPCIAYWNYDHFVVLDGFKNENEVVINDPAQGKIIVSMDEFDKSFTGLILTMKPNDKFVKSGKKKSIISFVKKYLSGTTNVMIFSISISILTTIFSSLNPVFSKIFIDRLLIGRNQNWIIPFFIFLISFAVIQGLLYAVNALYKMRIKGKLAIRSNVAYMWHTLNLPINFFSARQAEDIAIRKKENESIAEVFVDALAPTVINIFLMLIYLILMLKYSVMLSLIGIFSVMVNVVVNQIISTQRINILRVAMRDRANLDSMTVSGIEIIETIKSSSSENGFFNKWAGVEAKVHNSRVKENEIIAYYDLIPNLINEVVNIIILCIGIYLIIKGHMSIGSLFAFQSIYMLFAEPVLTLSDSTETIRGMVVSMERIEDVTDYEVDNTFKNTKTHKYEKIKGNIEIKNVTFGYSALEKPLIKNFSLKIEQGKKIAIVGGSGSGKSTISKLLSGLYTPWSGKILFDGKSISEIDKNVFKSSVAVVDQEISLYEDTISNNIKMWDDSIEDFEMILAARDASFHEDIMKKDGGYLFKINEDGKNLSGGERQRLEIARVLAADPTIIILDEATSALDAKTENEVVQYINARGITCIVIAHRLSTIRDADEIIVIDNGKIVERGTHKKLIKKNGRYKKLVLND